MVQSNQETEIRIPVQDENAAALRRTRTSKNDAGIFWDEALQIYHSGTINVNLYNNVLGFHAGDQISGTIDIEIGTEFEAVDLVVELKGVERSHLVTESHIPIQDHHSEC